MHNIDIYTLHVIFYLLCTYVCTYIQIIYIYIYNIIECEWWDVSVMGQKLFSTWTCHVSAIEHIHGETSNDGTIRPNSWGFPMGLWKCVARIPSGSKIA